jgi:uncharacterized membrane protein
LLLLILLPLAGLTTLGLVRLWPADTARNLHLDAAGLSTRGMSYPTARIIALAEASCEGMPGSVPDGSTSARCLLVSAEVLTGADKGSTTQVQVTSAVAASGIQVGQVIKLAQVPAQDGQPAQYQFSDFERRTPMVLIGLLFVTVVVAVARWRGFASLIGLAVGGFVLVKFIFPALLAGSNPILVALIGSSAIMFVVLYTAHGFTARTSTALLGTIGGLAMGGGLSWLTTRWAHLTGVANEDDYVLAAVAPHLHLSSVVMCGVVVAGLGVLNDVTITQASAVWELAESNPDRTRLFARAMRIGRDHIASTVYTIAFATVGASLPILMLIAVYDRPLLEVLQTEQFAEETLRTLVGSIGLVLAVPLTTVIGVAITHAGGTASQPDSRHSPSETGASIEAGLDPRRSAASTLR